MSGTGLKHRDIEIIKRWLIDLPHVDDGGPSFCLRFAQKMKEMGLPLWRLSYTLTTMHPEVLWRTMMWNPEDGIKIVDRPHAQLNQSIYTSSPIPSLRAGGPPIHVSLEKDVMPYPICQDMKDLGGTDYFAQGMPFSWGGYGYISWTTKEPGGFDQESIDSLNLIIPFLSRRIELESSYHVMNALLEVYLGKNAARRVRAGAFKRGEGERIPAVIWFCDLRGFTALSDTTEASELIQILDSYFDIVASSIAKHRGEVLKFIGDAVLAIFPILDSNQASCQSALDAADEALSELKNYNRDRNIAGKIEVATGIALHLGDVTYGNVGAKERLDFTVISPSVNEASRLESLCKPLKTSLTLSEDFIKALGREDMVDLGAHELKGVKKPLRVYTFKRFQLD
jgi:adenylate cyclase